MKIKILFGVFVCVFLTSCSTIPREKEWVTGIEPRDGTNLPSGERTVLYDGLTYDRVYNACERTLVRLGYAFNIADKSSGKIRVTDKARPGLAQAGVAGNLAENSNLQVEITKTDKGVAVKACVLRSSLFKPRPLDVNEDKKEVERFFKRLNRELK
jgi:hypothetical protein